MLDYVALTLSLSSAAVQDLALAPGTAVVGAALLVRDLVPGTGLVTEGPGPVTGLAHLEGPGLAHGPGIGPCQRRRIALAQDQETGRRAVATLAVAVLQRNVAAPLQPETRTAAVSGLTQDPVLSPGRTPAASLLYTRSPVLVILIAAVLLLRRNAQRARALLPRQTWRCILGVPHLLQTKIMTNNSA